MKKKLKVMTSFGLVPFEAIKEYIPQEKVEEVLAAASVAEVAMDSNNLEYYINKLALEKRWDYAKMVSYLKNLDKFSTTATFYILAKAVAVELDKKYEGGIESSEHIYTISVLNGKVYEMDKKEIKNYRNFAAFRTEQDAKQARSILKPILKKMFKGSGKQED